MPPADVAVLAVVIAARLLVPLAILRYPLPGILAAMVIDAADQTVFQQFTTLELGWYQGYDKALDVYYLAIAYIATMRNWTNIIAFRVSRFLWYYRLVGVLLFELSQLRVLLLVFANTFEYFFDFVEAARVRWNPRRLTPAIIIAAAAVIWIVVKLPQEWWIHIAELDTTDIVQEVLFGVPAGTGLGDTIAARPWVAVLAIALLVAIALVIRWTIQEKLPAADHRPMFDADREPGRAVDPAALDAVRRRMARRLIDWELAEKVALLTLVVTIFGLIMPGMDIEPLPFAAGVGVFVVLNAAISKWFLRRGFTVASIAWRFVATYAINLIVLVLMGEAWRIISGGTVEIQHGGFMLLLLTLMVTLYDRYRPEPEARFSASMERAPVLAG